MNGIDPRLRQRRIAVRRAEGRRRLRVVMVIGGLVTAAAIAFGLSRTPLFDLERVDVVGVDESIQLMIVDASGLTLGDPLLDLDTTAAREGVESLPWVEVAQVSRNWPEAVTIAVRTRSPIAVLPLGDGTGVMVDRSGVGITTTPSIDTVSVPMVSVLAEPGLGTVQVAALPALEVIELIPADLESWIEGYVITSDDSDDPEIVIDLVGTATAELGVAVELEAKLEALRTVIGRVDRRCLAVIDLRVAELPGVTRDEVCEDGADS